MFKLEIDTDNTSFDNGNFGNEEIARILCELADDLVNAEPGNYYEYALRDINGNTVGIATRSNY